MKTARWGYVRSILTNRWSSRLKCRLEQQVATRKEPLTVVVVGGAAQLYVMNDKRQMTSSGHPTQMTERIALLLSTRGSFFSRGAIDSWMDKSCLANQDRQLASMVTLVQD